MISSLSFLSLSHNPDCRLSLRGWSRYLRLSPLHLVFFLFFFYLICFFFQAEDGIRDLVRSRGLGDVYKRQVDEDPGLGGGQVVGQCVAPIGIGIKPVLTGLQQGCRCLLYTSDAADERSRVDLGGRRIIKKKKRRSNTGRAVRNKMKYSLK